MKLLHIVGRQNNGKTTLIVDLVKELTARDLRVGTLKHSAHEHELDKPGKDSYRHRIAGADPAACVTQNLIAIYIPRRQDDDPFDHISALFNDTDLVLVEGYIDRPGKKIEVWRQETGEAPIFSERDGGISAVITDSPIDTDLPVWPRTNVKGLADNICRMLEI